MIQKGEIDLTDAMNNIPGNQVNVGVSEMEFKEKVKKMEEEIALYESAIKDAKGALESVER